MIACGVATGGACIGVAGALLLAGTAGAGTAAGISAYQGRFSWTEVANGAFMGVLGGGLVFGLAGAGVFGGAAANAAFDMSWGVPAALSGEEGVGAGATALADEEAAAEDFGAESPPATGGGGGTTAPAQWAADGGSPEGGPIASGPGATLGDQQILSSARSQIDTADFASSDLRTYHFYKHGLDMGYMSDSEYVANARSLLRQALGGDFELWSRGSDVLAVDPQTGTFAVLDTQTGMLSTFFTPSEGYGYILRQIAEQGWRQLYG